MLNPSLVPDVTPSEIVARYLMFKNWYRADQTVRHDAFMPPDDLEFSVTRHVEANERELWQVGAQVAAERGRTLHGRADLIVNAFIDRGLKEFADPVPGNPNHAKVTGWPTEKSKQMLIAKLLAAVPGVLRTPPPSIPIEVPIPETLEQVAESILTIRTTDVTSVPAERATSLWQKILMLVKAFFARHF